MTDIRVRTLIRERIDAGDRDADVITRKVTSEIIDRGAAADLLYGLVRPSVVSLIRVLVQRPAEEAWDTAEKDKASAERAGYRSQDKSNAATKARADLLPTGFSAPGFGWVTWGAATVLQHESASGHSTGLASAHTADAKRHDKAVRLIRDAGVTCLGEVPGYADESWDIDK